MWFYVLLASPEDCLLTAPTAPSTGLIRLYIQVLDDKQASSASYYKGFKKYEIMKKIVFVFVCVLVCACMCLCTCVCVSA